MEHRGQPFGMENEGTQRAASGTRSTQLLRGPLFLSLLVHALGLGAALVWAAHREAPPALRIGSLVWHNAPEQAAVPPEPEDVVPPPLDETFELADALDQVVLAPQPEDLEAVFEEDPEPSVQPRMAFEELPLTAARGPRPAPVPAPAVVRLPPPAPRPTVVYVRPRPPTLAPPTPRVVPSPTQRSPVRVVWAPDPRRYYPATALQQGLGGRALVHLTIDGQGRVTHADIERTSGDALLDRAALELAYAYRFNPGTGLRATRLPVTFQPPAGTFGS